MSYATLPDIEDRYPGELTQAGPTVEGALDDAAVEGALLVASNTVDLTLRAIGWTVPVVAPVPRWIVDLTVDMALYLATPTALASQTDFADRRKRYDTALSVLDDIASGKRLPPSLAGATVTAGVFFSSQPRQFGRGAL